VLDYTVFEKFTELRSARLHGFKPISVEPYLIRPVIAFGSFVTDRHSIGSMNRARAFATLPATFTRFG
jgi:hypothetical protein